MRFKGLDLNLLAALDALIEEQSVSAAARRLHLSQPAMSAALSRLREHLGDPLLVPFGKRMILTAHAERMAQPLREILSRVEVLTGPSVFDPATSRRVFRINASDYIVTVLITPLVHRLSEEAPGVRLIILNPADRVEATLERGDVDLLIMPQQFTSRQHPSIPLFVDTHVVVGWAGNPAMDAPMTEAVFFDHGHVVVEFGSLRHPAFAEEQMRQQGRPRRVEIVAASFSSVPGLLVVTRRLALMQKRLADRFARILPLKTAPPPVAFPEFREMIQHHQTRAEDEGLTWLIDRIQAVVATEL
jgi:LysR family nod box-dependent transcriptional activator